MSRHMNLLQTTVGSDGGRVLAEAMGVAVAVTGDELITARAGLLRRGNKIERRALVNLTGVRALPNPHASLLELTFDGGPAITMMFEPTGREHYDHIVALLREQLERNKSAASAPQASAPEPARQGHGV